VVYHFCIAEAWSNNRRHMPDNKTFRGGIFENQMAWHGDLYDPVGLSGRGNVCMQFTHASTDCDPHSDGTAPDYAATCSNGDFCRTDR
jgi:hypothetical protein